MSESATDAGAKTLWSEYGFWWGWLFGTLVSTVGLISFVQHVFGLQLIPAYAHGLAAYRFVAHTVMNFLYAPFVNLAQYLSLSWLHWPLKIVIPGWWKDLAVISTVCTMAKMRSEALAHAYLRRVRGASAGPRPLSVLIRLLQAFVAGMALMGFVDLVGLTSGISIIGTLEPASGEAFLSKFIEDGKEKFGEDWYARFVEDCRKHLGENWRQELKEGNKRHQEVMERFFVYSMIGITIAFAFFYVTNAYGI